MSTPEQNQNNIRPDAKLMDLLSLLKKDILLSMNCHGIATVEKVDVANQTIQATMNYKKTQFERKGNSENYTKKLVDYPVLIDVPFIVLTGGSFSLRMPIKKGDTCLILFNDRDIDRWYESGQVTGVSSPRLHSFSDGIALVGVRSQANKIEDYDPDKFQVTDGNANFEMGPDSLKANFDETILELKAKIKMANGAGNLKAILEEIIDLITGIQIIVPGGSSAGTYPVDPGTTAGGTAAKSSVGGLLE